MEGHAAVEGRRSASAGFAGRAAWAFYDWANSSYAAVITTFVFSAYFAKGVVGDEVRGTELWGYAISAASFTIAVLAPLLGAVADRTGRRKPWILVFTLILAVTTALLWRVEPDPAFVVTALMLVALSNVAFELAGVFYNAMLPGLAEPGRIGRLSGLAWGLGYVGGIVCLGVILVGFIQAETPWFGLDKDSAEHLRAAGPFVAVWLLVFSLPLFLITPDAPATGVGFGLAVKKGAFQLRETFAHARRHEGILIFLAAYMIYIDGLITVFSFGGIYAAGTFGLTFEDLILFGIGMNVSAGLGAVLFSLIDDRIGPKRTVLTSLICLMAFGAAIVLVEGKTAFFAFALALGLFVGPAQAAGRSMMAHLAPEDLRGQMFGFMALAGKATSFLGPLAVATVTAAADSQRAGMATILLFFAIGFLLFLRVPDVRAKPSAS